MVDLAHEGMTMMVVTHEMGFARKVANRVIFMDRGEIVEDAAKEDFFGKPRSDRAQKFLSKILFLYSSTVVFSGCAFWCGLGIHNLCLLLWIPGSSLRASPE